MASLFFTPSNDVAVILHALLDMFERRNGEPRRVVRVNLGACDRELPGYCSQTDPGPRTTSNEQLSEMEKLGLVHLTWQPGQTGHLLETVTMNTEQAEPLYTLLERVPLADRRSSLHTLLLGDRFRLDAWRRQAVDHVLDQLKAHTSPVPFSLVDETWNWDLLAALVALPEDGTEEIPYRVFSVRVFNDSKRFDALKGAVARLARRHQPQWRALSNQETLREMGLVPNPGHLHLYGPWRLVDSDGQVMSLSEYYPSVGIPTALAACVEQVRVGSARVVCVENMVPFYELVRHERQDLAALCISGNPSPASRHLLRCLAENLPEEVPLLLWADIDYGGLNILAQLRTQVSRRIAPYRMDAPTLDAHALWAKPLTATDERNLTRLSRHPALTDLTPLINEMLVRGIKLEQEAIVLGSNPLHHPVRRK